MPKTNKISDDLLSDLIRILHALKMGRRVEIAYAEEVLAKLKKETES